MSQTDEWKNPHAIVIRENFMQFSNHHSGLEIKLDFTEDKQVTVG